MKLNNIKLFLAKLDIDFKNIELYKIAFTHTSYVHETKELEIKSYERLEFLGDAILGTIIAEYLYKTYDSLTPGELSLFRSNIVNKESLSTIAKKLELEKFIYFGKGEKNKIPTNSVYEDILESLIGAIYLDLDSKRTMEIVIKIFKPYILAIDLSELKDYKTQLQEELQSEKRKTVNYITYHQKKLSTGEMEFSVRAMLDEIILGHGTAKSKKKAQQKAAKFALERKAEII